MRDKQRTKRGKRETQEEEREERRGREREQRRKDRGEGGSAHQVHGGVDGGVGQPDLVGRGAGVGHGPAQVAAVHVLAQRPAGGHVVHADAPLVLERGCARRAGAGARSGPRAACVRQRARAAGRGGGDARCAHCTSAHDRLRKSRERGTHFRPLQACWGAGSAPMHEPCGRAHTGLAGVSQNARAFCARAGRMQDRAAARSRRPAQAKREQRASTRGTPCR